MLKQSTMKDQKHVSIIHLHFKTIKLFSYSLILLSIGLFIGLTLGSYPSKIHENIINMGRGTTMPSKTSSFQRDYMDTWRKKDVMNDIELIKRALGVSRRDQDVSKQEVSKIAFMFMVKGSLPLAPLWGEFFKGHQGFYSIYVHSDPTFDSSMEMENGVFHGSRIPSQEVQWGTFSMIEAEVRLLANALLDISNQRFILLSESCIPLFNFSTIYNYLINSTQIHVDSYDLVGPTGRGRYSRYLNPYIKKEQWRKGSQWFELDRAIAHSVIADYSYLLLFKNACIFGKGKCYADEHYFPTWMSVNNIRKNSNRSLTYVDWSHGGIHPARHRRMDVTFDLLERLRNGKKCAYNGDESNVCFLFARKFTPDALDRLLKFAPKVMYFY